METGYNMGLDAKILSDALMNMYVNLESDGEERGLWSRITKASGVYNISRLARGEIKNPTYESWLKLHNAYPSEIPPPTFTPDSKVVIQEAVGKQKNQVVNFREIEKQKLINEFLDPEKALELCELLKDIEKNDPTGYEVVEGFIRGRHSSIKKSRPKKIATNRDR